jgi:hypothetical protein
MLLQTALETLFSGDCTEAAYIFEQFAEELSEGLWELDTGAVFMMLETLVEQVQLE